MLHDIGARMSEITVSETRRSVWHSLFEPLRLAGRLFSRHWAALILVAALGSIAQDLLLFAAVETGMRNALAGMIMLSLVVLTKLVVIVVMLQTLRPSLPAVQAVAKPPGPDSPVAPKPRERSLSIIAAAILPFFAYYAAWGFLSDTVRSYSRSALNKTEFGEKATFLDVLQSRWLLVSILACWLIRYLAKRANAAWPASFWSFVVVAANATWIFIGLYVLSAWQEELLRWIGSGDFMRSLPKLEGIEAWFSMSAWAAGPFVPHELTPTGWLTEVRGLFISALLPIVWFLMIAVIYGHDFSTPPKPQSAAGSTAVPHWRRWLGDVANHFFGGYRSRYTPIWRSVRLALGAGAPTLCVLIVSYYAIGYAGAWIWMGLTRLIGEQPLFTWQVIAAPVGLLFGSLGDLTGGIVFDALRICLLAAVFEVTVSHSRKTRDGSAIKD